MISPEYIKSCICFITSIFVVIFGLYSINKIVWKSDEPIKLSYLFLTIGIFLLILSIGSLMNGYNSSSIIFLIITVLMFIISVIMRSKDINKRNHD